MAACLVEQTIPRIDQQDREVGGGSFRGHVARVLLMTRRIRQNEPALRRFEKPIGDVDRHALFSFRLQTIDQQRVIDATLDGAKPAKIRSSAVITSSGVESRTETANDR